MEEHKVLVRASNGRMVFKRLFGISPAMHAAQARLEESKAAYAQEQQRQRDAAGAWAETAVNWIAENRHELTLGMTAKLSFIDPNSAQASLAELEDSYKGNAMRVFETDMGELWWLDREGRPASQQVFATRCAGRSGAAIEFEIRFQQLGALGTGDAA